MARQPGRRRSWCAGVHHWATASCSAPAKVRHGRQLARARSRARVAATRRRGGANLHDRPGRALETEAGNAGTAAQGGTYNVQGRGRSWPPPTCGLVGMGRKPGTCSKNTRRSWCRSSKKDPREFLTGSRRKSPPASKAGQHLDRPNPRGRRRRSLALDHIRPARLMQEAAAKIARNDCSSAARSSREN